VGRARNELPRPQMPPESSGLVGGSFRTRRLMIHHRSRPACQKRPSAWPHWGHSPGLPDTGSSRRSRRPSYR
jgi:hypothetical protein